MRSASVTSMLFSTLWRFQKIYSIDGFLASRTFLFIEACKPTRFAYFQTAQFGLAWSFKPAMEMKKLSSVSALSWWRPFSGVLRHPRFPRVHRLVHQLQQVGHPPGQLLGGQKRQNLAGLSSRSVINYYLRFFI